MTTVAPDPPAPFTPVDYLARMRRAATDATQAGLDGLVVMPGPGSRRGTTARTRSLTESLPMLRAVEDAAELARLEAADAATDATYEDIVGVRFAGRRETDVAADLARLLVGHGHEQVDFTVVGSGPHGANPHHEVVRLAQQAGVDAVRPGVACQEIDRAQWRNSLPSTARTPSEAAPADSSARRQPCMPARWAPR